LVNFVAASEKSRAAGFGGERAAVKEVLLDMIGDAKPELGVVHQAGENVLRIAVGKSGGWALRDWITSGKWASAITVKFASAGETGFVEKSVLAIVQEKTESAELAGAVADGVEIVNAVVAGELSDRSIDVAGEENIEHVVDEVFDIEQIFVRRIQGAVGKETLNFEVIDIAGEAVGRRLPKAEPGIEIAVGRENGIAGARIDFDDVVVFFDATEIGFGVGGFGPLAGIVEAPILAVNEEMVKIAALGGLNSFRTFEDRSRRRRQRRSGWRKRDS
jgi:hypothetical protein